MKNQRLFVALTAGILMFSSCGKDSPTASTGNAKAPDAPTVSVEDGSVGEHSDQENAKVTTDDSDILATAISDVFSIAREVIDSDIEAGTQYSESVEGTETGTTSIIASMSETETYATISIAIAVDDYSDDGFLFLGGAIGMGIYDDENSFEMNVKGEQVFTGSLKGSITYDCYVTENYVSGEVTISGSIIISSDDFTYDIMPDLIEEMNK